MRNLFPVAAGQITPDQETGNTQEEKKDGGNHPIDIQCSPVNFMDEKGIEKGTGNLGDTHQGKKLPERQKGEAGRIADDIKGNDRKEPKKKNDVFFIPSEGRISRL